MSLLVHEAPVTLLAVVAAHVAAVQNLKLVGVMFLATIISEIISIHCTDRGEVVGAALLPVPDALRPLSVGLRALDVDTRLVAQHQLRLVCNIRK